MPQFIYFYILGRDKHETIYRTQKCKMRTYGKKSIQYVSFVLTTQQKKKKERKKKNYV